MAVIDVASNTITATITVDNHPEEIAITPDATRAYVTCGSFGTSSSVWVIDTATNTVVTTIAMPFGSFARGIAITPDGKAAYVSNLAANNVSIINTATNTVTGAIAVGNSPAGVAIGPDGTRAYVANGNSSSVSVIDTTTNLVIGTVPVGDSPHNVAVTPDGKHVYIADTTYPQGYVSVIDAATNQVTTFPAGEGTSWVAVTPDGAQVYATNFTSVSVIDTATNTITSTIPAGTEENGIAFSRDGLHAYVASTSEGGLPQNAISVIETATKAVSATILFPPGSGPFGVAVPPVSSYSATIQQPINSDGSSVFKANRGVVPVKFTLATSGASTCQLPPATISLFRTSGDTPGPIDESVFLDAADNGSNFRITGCQYIYNLGTSSLGIGSYEVRVNISGAVAGTGKFGLR